MGRKKRVALCDCGGEMLDGICLACGWWPGRGNPPGEMIDGVRCNCKGSPMGGERGEFDLLEEDARRLAIYIREHAVPMNHSGKENA